MFYENKLLHPEGAPSVDADEIKGYGAQVFWAEVVCTAFFVTVIMAVKFYTPIKNEPLGGIAVAMTLYGMIMVSGKVSGGCLNPAVAFTAIITQYSPFIPFYMPSTFIGGMLGGIFGSINHKMARLDEDTVKFNVE